MLTIALALALLPAMMLSAYAADTAISVPGDWPGGNVITVGDGETLTILAAAGSPENPTAIEVTGNAKIIGHGGEIINLYITSAAAASLTIENLSISAPDGKSAVALASGSTLTLTEINMLNRDARMAGVHVPDPNTLAINGSGSLLITANPAVNNTYAGGAGIGGNGGGNSPGNGPGNPGETAGTVTIDGAVTIESHGGSVYESRPDHGGAGAGIGGGGGSGTADSNSSVASGSGGGGGTLIMSGGTLKAYVGGGACGMNGAAGSSPVGATNGSGVAATISGGSIDGTVDGTIKTTGGADVYKVTVTVTDGANPVSGATLSTGSYNAGTDSAGKAYIYLPNGSHTVRSQKSGLPTTDGSVTINNGATSVSIQMIPMSITPAAVSNGMVGTTYSQTISASGGTAPYTYAVQTGTLPGGLTLNGTTGEISGTPTVTVTNHAFTIRATDSIGNYKDISYTFTILLAPATDATLKTVLEQTVIFGAETGADISNAKTAAIAVTNNVSTLAAANIVPNDTNATVKFGSDSANLNTMGVSLSVGANTIYIEITAQDGATKLYYKVTIMRQSGGSTGGNGGGSSDPTPTTTEEKVKIGEVEIPYTQDKDGVVTAAPTERQVKDVIANAEGGPVVFDFSGVEGVTGIVFEVDPAWFDGAGDVMVLLGGGMSLTIQDGMMGELVNRYGGMVEFSVKMGSITVSISQDGEAIDWYSFEYPMIVSMPSKSKETIRTVMINKVTGEAIARSWYADGQLYAKVYRAGTYDEQLAEPIFSDMDNHWAWEAVKYTASRGVVTGRGLTGDGDNIQPYFAPDALVTRAEFLTMLMRALNPEPQGAWMVQQFADIPEGAYYYDIALKAKALGITSGTGNNKFNPNATISRQDMFTMLYNAMELMKMTQETYTEQFIEFADWDDVADYARNPIQNLAKLGLVSGKPGGLIDSKGTATRAEAAQVIYNVLKRDAG